MKRLMQSLLCLTALATLTPALAAYDCDALNGTWHLENPYTSADVVIADQDSTHKHIQSVSYFKEEGRTEWHELDSVCISSEEATPKLKVTLTDRSDVDSMTIRLIDQQTAVIDAYVKSDNYRFQETMKRTNK